MADDSLKNQQNLNEEVKKTKASVDKLAAASADMANSVERGLHAWEKTKKEVIDINKDVETIVDYTKKMADLQQKQLTDNKHLQKIYEDKTKLLAQQFFTESKLYEMYEKQLAAQNKIKLLSEAIEKKRPHVIGINDDKTKEFAALQVELHKTIKLEKEYGNSVSAISSELDKQGKTIPGIGGKFGGIGDSLKGIMSGIKNPMEFMSGKLGVWAELFKELVKILFQQNREVTQLQKTLLISGDAARQMRERFVEAERSASGMGSAFETVKNQLEASVDLAEAFGASVDFSQGKTMKMVKDQIQLTKELGLSGKEAADLQSKMSMIGLSAKQIGELTAKSVIETKLRTGVTVNLKNAMAEISKMSAATFLSLSKYPKALTDAVVKAKELGVGIDKMNSIADGLLSIETSLTSQFEASVLSGRQLNFELAREKALRNDIVGATKDILSQVGSAVQFGDMNRITQDAIAKSVGMTKDELAASLITQENLAKLGEEERDRMKEMLKGKTQEQQMAIMQKITNNEDAYAYAKKVAAQDKINQMTEKFYSILGNVFSALEPIVDVIADIFEWLGPIVGIVAKLGANVVKYLVTPFREWGNILQGIVKIFKGDFYDGIKMIGQGIVNMLIAPFKFMATQVETVLNGLLDMAYKIPGATSLFGDKPVIDYASKLQEAVTLGDGGIVPAKSGGTMANIGEAGKAEAVIPLDKLSQMITPPQQRPISQQVNNNADVVEAIKKLETAINNIKLQIDGREFGRLVTSTTSQKVARA